MALTLRILHVTPYAADAWAYGGIPRVNEMMEVVMPKGKGTAGLNDTIIEVTGKLTVKVKTVPFPLTASGTRAPPSPVGHSADGGCTHRRHAPHRRISSLPSAPPVQKGRFSAVSVGSMRCDRSGVVTVRTLLDPERLLTRMI